VSQFGVNHPGVIPHGRQPASRPEGEGAHGQNIFLAFAPWIIFDVVAGPSTWKLAAFSALVASVVLTVPDIRRHHGAPKLLDLAGIVFFAVISILGLALDRQQLIWLETYSQTISNGTLALTALGSLAHVPFTEQYARESTPREVWDSPVFKHVNRVLTAMWGLVFAITAILGLIALHVSSGTDWLNWVIPIILLVLAVRFTRWYPAYMRSQNRQTHLN
jgi:hypothetical protein